MPILKNTRHEHFAQNLAKGMSQTQAYIEAGYSKTGADGHAARLVGKGSVATRVAELQQRAAVRTEKTIASLVEKIDQIIEIALSAETPQSSAAISGVVAQAKLLGIEPPQKTENTNRVIVISPDDAAL